MAHVRSVTGRTTYHPTNSAKALNEIVLEGNSGNSVWNFVTNSEFSRLFWVFTSIIVSVVNL